MRFLAGAWLVIGLSFFASRAWISILVFGEVQYTLAAMASLSVVAPLQAVALTWALGRIAPRQWPAATRSLLARPLVGLVWVGAMTVVGVFFAAAAGTITIGFAPQRALELGGGATLIAAASLFLGRAARGPTQAGGVWIVLLGVVSACLGAFSAATGLGFRVISIVHFAPMTAAVSIVLPFLLVPLMLRVARSPAGNPSQSAGSDEVRDASPEGSSRGGVSGRTSRAVATSASGPMEVAAVCSAAIVSVTPMCFYLRPYLGVHWLTPGLLLFFLAATCVLSAAVLGLNPGSSAGREPSSPLRLLSVRIGLAVWMILVVMYATVWFAGSSVLGSGTAPSSGFLVELFLVPAGQTVALLLWFVVPAAVGEGGLSVVCPPRRWVLVPLVIEGVALVVAWWRWPAGDGPWWAWFVVWGGLKGGALGIIVAATTLRRARGPVWMTVLGLVMVVVSGAGMTTWHAAIWVCVIAVLIVGPTRAEKTGLLLVGAALTAAAMIVIPSFVMGRRPLDVGVAAVVSIGVLTVSAIFGWLPGAPGDARNARAR